VATSQTKVLIFVDDSGRYIFNFSGADPEVRRKEMEAKVERPLTIIHWKEFASASLAQNAVRKIQEMLASKNFNHFKNWYSDLSDDIVQEIMTGMENDIYLPATKFLVDKISLEYKEVDEKKYRAEKYDVYDNEDDAIKALVEAAKSMKAKAESIIQSNTL